MGRQYDTRIWDVNDERLIELDKELANVYGFHLSPDYSKRMGMQQLIPEIRRLEKLVARYQKIVDGYEDMSGASPDFIEEDWLQQERFKK